MCRIKKNTGDVVIPVSYGKVASMVLDPTEKKPLGRLLPGSIMLSVGNLGCNLRYPFCQNHKISMAGEEDFESVAVSPEELVQKAAELGKNGDIDIAYACNEPLVGQEYVRDIGRLARKAGVKNAIVTNGSASDQALDEILPVADAMNIDSRGSTENYYRKLGGDPETVKHFITCVSRRRCVELTAFIVSGGNDSDKEMREMADWISSLSPEVPLYVTKFLPH